MFIKGKHKRHGSKKKSLNYIHGEVSLVVVVVQGLGGKLIETSGAELILKAYHPPHAYMRSSHYNSQNDVGRGRSTVGKEYVFLTLSGSTSNKITFYLP